MFQFSRISIERSL